MFVLTVPLSGGFRIIDSNNVIIRNLAIGEPAPYLQLFQAHVEDNANDYG